MFHMEYMLSACLSNATTSEMGTEAVTVVTALNCTGELKCDTEGLHMLLCLPYEGVSKSFEPQAFSPFR